MLVDAAWLRRVVASHTPTFHLHHTDAYLPCSAEWFLQHCELRQQAPGGHEVLLPRGAVAGPLLLEAQAAAPPGTRQWLALDPAARGGQPLASAVVLLVGGSWLVSARATPPLLRLALDHLNTLPPPAAPLPPPQAELNDVPCYAHPKAVVAPDGAVEALEITYVTVRGCCRSESVATDAMGPSMRTRCALPRPTRPGCPLPPARHLPQVYAYNGPYRVGGAPFLVTGAHDADIEHLTVR